MIKQKFGNYGAIKRRRHQLDLSLKDILPVNTYVRLLAINADRVFNKSYVPLFTEEVFAIESINLKENPITYRLRDLNREIIEGRVYRNELKVAAKPTLFDIEKIIQKNTVERPRKN